MRAATLLCAFLPLAASGFARDQRAEDSGPIAYKTNSEFRGSHLRVFRTLKDGRPVSVNTTDDAVNTRPAETPIPGHRARVWTCVKDTGEGTSVVHALASWDDDDPADCLMLGRWVEIPDRNPPELSFEAWTGYTMLFDGPETDPDHPLLLPALLMAINRGHA